MVKYLEKKEERRGNFKIINHHLFRDDFTFRVAGLAGGGNQGSRKVYYN